MTVSVLYLAALALGYLLGAIPFAVLIAKYHGVDIFAQGSGNPGATNVLRTLGKKPGYLCFALDALKGVLAVLVGLGLGTLNSSVVPVGLAIGALLGAILGHSFSVFLRFRGGKGVATTVGGMFTLLPLVMVIGALLWIVVFKLSRYVSLASIVLGVSLPVSALALGRSTVEVLFCFFLSALILVRHRANIQRLLAGTENRAGAKRP